MERRFLTHFNFRGFCGFTEKNIDGLAISTSLLSSSLASFSFSRFSFWRWIICCPNRAMIFFSEPMDIDILTIKELKVSIGSKIEWGVEFRSIHGVYG